MTSFLHSMEKSMESHGADILHKMKDAVKVVPNSPKQTAASTNAPTVPTVVTDLSSSSSSPQLNDANDANDSNDALINQISNLQKLEDDKYIALDALLKSNPSPDNVAQRKTIMNDITEIATIRSKLFDTMLNNANNHAIVNEQMNSNLENKKTIVSLKEDALNARRIALEDNANNINNAKRMVGINTYFHKQYEARVKIMKFIALLCFIIIFFIVLMHLGWLPQELVTVIVVITLFGGMLYIGSLINDMYKRNNINFDEYNYPIDSNYGSKIAQSTKSKKSRSTDRSSCLYNSVAAEAASIEDSISSKATSLEDELTGTPDPSQSSSSLSSASTSAGGADGTTTLPSVKSKLSESFLPLMSRMDRRQFNSNDAQHPAAYDSENNFGKI
jgi:ABC-type multidrug transport system fused ATPase/permease subunit